VHQHAELGVHERECTSAPNTSSSSSEESTLLSTDLVNADDVGLLFGIAELLVAETTLLVPCPALLEALVCLLGFGVVLLEMARDPGTVDTEPTFDDDAEELDSGSVSSEMVFSVFSSFADTSIPAESVSLLGTDLVNADDVGLLFSIVELLVAETTLLVPCPALLGALVGLLGFSVVLLKMARVDLLDPGAVDTEPTLDNDAEELDSGSASSEMVFSVFSSFADTSTPA